MAEPAVCTLEGNYDLYGLGIRLGIYTSLLATSYVKYHLPSALPGTMTTNAIFMFAVLVAIVKNAVSDQIAAFEAFVMLQIIFGYILSGAEGGALSLYFVTYLIPDLSPADQDLVLAQIAKNPLTYVCLSILRVATATLNTWFWFKGYNNLSQPCSFRLFFFRDFHGTGPIRYPFQAAAAIYIGYQIMRQISDLFLAHRHLKLFLKNFRSGSPESKTATGTRAHISRALVALLTLVTDPTKDEVVFKEMRTSMSEKIKTLTVAQVSHLRQFLKFYRYALILRDNVMIIWTILVVEFTLYWSNVTAVYSVSSTGQIIPLVIGLTSTFPIISGAWATIMKKSKIAARIDTIVVDHSSGLWRYRLRDDTTVQFRTNLSLSRRRSFEEYSAATKQKDQVDEVPKRENGLRILPPPFTFVRTGFGSELRGAPIYPVMNSNVQPWRRYFALRDGTMQVFSTECAAFSSSNPEVMNPHPPFVPWRFKLIWRGMNREPLTGRVYRAPRFGRTSFTSSTDSDITWLSVPPPRSRASSTESSARSSLSRSTSPSGYEAPRTRWYEVVGRWSHAAAAKRRGRRCVEEVNVLLSTGKFFQRIGATESSFETPCSFEQLSNELERARRRSFDDYDMRRPRELPKRKLPRIQPYLFPESRRPAWEQDSKHRPRPWSKSRMFAFYMCVTCVMFICISLCIYSPNVVLVLLLLYIGDESDHGVDSTTSRKPSDGKKDFSDFVRRSALACWRVPQIVAYECLKPRDDYNEGYLLHFLPTLCSSLPSILSLFLIGTPVYILLELGRSVGIDTKGRDYQNRLVKRWSRPTKLYIAICVYTISLGPLGVPILGICFVFFAGGPELVKKFRSRPKRILAFTGLLLVAVVWPISIPLLVLYRLSLLWMGKLFRKRRRRLSWDKV